MNSAHSQKQLQAATRNWADQFSDRYQYAVSLTLKPYRNAYDTRGIAHRQQLTPDIAWHTFAAFQTKLNRQIYNHAARRFQKTLTYVPVLEGERSGKLLHFHCAIGDVPDRVNAIQFGKHVAAAWHDTDFGNTQVDVQLYRNGWIGYITKDRSPDGTGIGWKYVVIGDKP